MSKRFWLVMISLSVGISLGGGMSVMVEDGGGLGGSWAGGGGWKVLRPEMVWGSVFEVKARVGWFWCSLVAIVGYWWC